MAAPAVIAPLVPWTVAVHTSRTDHHPRGTGIVIDTTHVLTSAHVVQSGDQWLEEIWIAFPNVDSVSWGTRCKVARCRGGTDFNIDVALLELSEPVPVQVTPARLRCLAAHDLRDHRWWAFGFPVEHGSEAHGTVGSSPLSYGVIRLDTTSAYGIEVGFSGGPVWSPDYEAVVGIVTRAAAAGEHQGAGYAVTLSYVDIHLPDWKLSVLANWTAEALDEQALASWGWSLRADPELGRHWQPRSRGVTVDSERGYRFRGRTEALTDIVKWLDAALVPQRVLLVTGSPGVGKSAVLGRIVTTADPDIHRHLPADDDAVRARVGSVSCAIHVKGKSAIDVATEIARAASLPLPEMPEDVVCDLQKHLSGRVASFNLIVDALDEAADPEQARLIVQSVLLPLAETCARVVVGTRRNDSAGDLLAEFGSGLRLVDLDDELYFAESDLATYARATLQLVGEERPGNPYLASSVAEPLARRIAAMASGNFLIAGLFARMHGVHDVNPVDLDSISYPSTVEAALDAYLDVLGPIGNTSARLALTVLAYAETPGLPIALWRAGLIALGGNTSEEELRTFARTSAANFLVETATDPIQPTYRLFHQALNESLLRECDGVRRRDDQRQLFEAWLHHGRAHGWPTASAYLLRSLPSHAVRGEEIDTLLCDDDYLLHADLRKLIPAAEKATTSVGMARAQLLQRTPLAVDAEPAHRAAMFSVSQQLDRLDSRFEAPAVAPYLGLWAHTPARLERTVLEGHSEGVLAVSALTVGGRTLLASAGQDSTVRLWDPVTGQTERVMADHGAPVRTVCALAIGDRTILASAGEDRIVRLWDPQQGSVRVLNGSPDWVRSLCAIHLGGQDVLASACDDGKVRLWDPRTGELVRLLDDGPDWITAVCPVPTDHGMRLASASYDGMVRLWDLQNSKVDRYLNGHKGAVTALCAWSIAGGTRLASASYDRTAIVWDAASGYQEQVLRGHTRPITGICTVQVDHRLSLATTSEDRSVRLWDPLTARALRVLEGHSDWTRAICSVQVDTRHMLASTSDDTTVRLWDPATGKSRRVINGGRIGAVAGLCEVASDEGSLLASANSNGSIRIWNSNTGKPLATLQGHSGPVRAVCTITTDDGNLIASASEDRTVRLWSLLTRQTVRVLKEHYGTVTAVSPVQGERRQLLASACDDGTVRLWNPNSGRAEQVIDSMSWVTAVCPIAVEGLPRLVTADVDGNLQLWNPATGRRIWALHGHSEAVTAVCRVAAPGGDLLASASSDGTIRLWDPASGRPVRTLSGHGASVNGLCVVPFGDGDRIASASDDRSVRLWDPGSGMTRESIPVHHRAMTCCFVEGKLVVGLDTGLLAIALQP